MLKRYPEGWCRAAPLIILCSGGYGTHGAAGGNGGTIEVTVREEHMNLLITVLWNVSGGNGGAAGAHGSGGAGGDGGRGGDGITW